MCGICGELILDGDGVVSPDVVRAMTTAIAHRGPDDHGVYVTADARVGLGFRRLAILDLRGVANQPMPNPDATARLVFNGEIYNFRELRRELESRGHRFQTTGDTEVILHMYDEFGEAMAERLDGMFAIAIWDERKGSMFLCRDRAGKKPLFIYDDGKRVAFASEIKALLVNPALAIEPDHEAVPQYFVYGYVPHPRTFYRHIRHIEPGTTMVVERNGIRRARQYWQLRFPVAGHHANVARPEAIREVRQLVTAAVERRLVSDVPLGAFLSGGVDSTIIVALMSQLMKEPVKTFSIGFEGDAAFDETSVARATAARFGTHHTEFRVQPSALDLLPKLVWHHDGPFADSSAIPTYLVAKLTREHVTVALNGDGGDEVFAGYLRFGAALGAQKIPAPAGKLAAATAAWLPPASNERHWRSRARRFARFMKLPLDDRLAAWAGVFYDDVEKLLGIDGGHVDRRAHLSGLTADLAGISPLSRLLLANFTSYLHDDLLVKADRMSMANSLEARSPYLDRALIEYVATLPDDFKISGTKTKVILREAFADLLPPDVAQGSKKGFGVPLDAWFRGELQPYLRDTLLASGSKAADYVSIDYVRGLVDNHVAGRANHGHRLWTLLTFENWLQQLPSWRNMSAAL